MKKWFLLDKQWWLASFIGNSKVRKLTLDRYALLYKLVAKYAVLSALEREGAMFTLARLGPSHESHFVSFSQKII